MSVLLGHIFVLLFYTIRLLMWSDFMNSLLDKQLLNNSSIVCSDVMSVEEMCSFLKISRKTGYKLLKKGRIKSIRIGRIYRISKIHIYAYLNCNM